MIPTWLAGLSFLVWLYIVFGRGGFWRISRWLLSVESAPRAAKRIAAVIPARNEADAIGQSVRSLLQQECEEIVQVILVDDSSEDGTAEVARLSAFSIGQSHRLTVLPGKPLPAGWTGKLWAVCQGIEYASRFDPDYLLLTDADILHGGHNLRQLVSIAEQRNCDMASLMVLLATHSFAEKATIPAFVYFFLQLYPPLWTDSRNRKTAGAAGGCILIRPQALARIGGIEAIRGAVIDDCALAKAVKVSGGRVWMGLTAKTISLRSYQSFGEVRRMISRTAFNQLNHSTILLAGTALGLLLTYAVPVIAIVGGNIAGRILGAATWILMAATYYPTVALNRRNPLWALSLPAVALFYLWSTVRSAVSYWSGQGGQWKGRIQDIRQ